MPTTDKVQIFEVASIDRGYQAGYADGLAMNLSRQEGERRGWEMGKEAAAELAEGWARLLICRKIAAAIRKLKKS